MSQKNIVFKGEWYPIAEDEQNLAGHDRKTDRARWTGEHRPPRAGEWYLSGAIVAAYYSPSNHRGPMAYHIAEIVRGEFVWQPKEED